MTLAQLFSKAPVCKPRQLAAFEGSTQPMLKAKQLRSAGKKDRIIMCATLEGWHIIMTAFPACIGQSHLLAFANKFSESPK